MGDEACAPSRSVSQGKDNSTPGRIAPHTRQAIGLPSPNKTDEVVLAFLRDLVLPHFGMDRKLYLIWDNFSAHKRARNLWTTAPTNIQFYWTPTNAS